MPRKIVPTTHLFPYHVSARCLNREWFEIPLSDVWCIFEDYLCFIHHNFGIEILSFVLMANHFHLILKAPNSNLSAAMNYFMRETSRQILQASGRINHIYGGRFSRSLITSNHYFMCAYKYVYRNPVEAKFCGRVEDYRFSTLAGLLGARKLSIPLSEDLTLFSDVEGTLSWLNTAREKPIYEAVRKAIKKSAFEFGKNKKTGKPHELTTNLY